DVARAQGLGVTVEALLLARRRAPREAEEHVGHARRRRDDDDAGRAAALDDLDGVPVRARVRERGASELVDLEGPAGRFAGLLRRSTLLGFSGHFSGRKMYHGWSSA